MIPSEGAQVGRRTAAIGSGFADVAPVEAAPLGAVAAFGVGFAPERHRSLSLPIHKYARGLERPFYPKLGHYMYFGCSW